MTKVLLVEDDTDLCETMKDWLTFNNYNVDKAYDGAEGLQKMCSECYDMVILDWQLPHMDGPDICKAYRSHGGHAPVLMLTGRRESGAAQATLDAGATDYLSKPFTLKQLTDRLHMLESNVRA